MQSILRTRFERVLLMTAVLVTGVELPMAYGQWAYCSGTSGPVCTSSNVGVGVTPSIALQVNGSVGPTATENMSAGSGQLSLNSNSGIKLTVGGTTMANPSTSGSSGNLLLSGSWPAIGFGSWSRGLTTTTGSNWLTLYNAVGPIALQQGASSFVVVSNGLWGETGTPVGIADNASGYSMWDVEWTRPGGGNGQAAMGISTSAAPYAGGNLLFVTEGNEGGAYSHAAQLDPTFIIHSRTAAGSATNQWMSFQHNTVNGVIQTGTGSLILNPGGGNVGIGTGSTVLSHQLQVAGSIGAEEVVVSSTGADYVFDDGYKLASLSDVAAYIAANHHLPGIPSAEEMKEKGSSVSEMQSKLLAKIEELTLHMIEMEEQTKAFRKENQRLSSEVTELREQLK